MSIKNSSPSISKSILAAHEGKHAAHLTQEVFDPGDDRPFKFSFAVLLAQFEKVEGVFISDRQLGLVFDRFGQGFFKVGLAQQGLFIGLVLDAKRQDILGPAEFAGHADVEFPLPDRPCSVHDDQMFRPADFSNQWLEFWVPRIGQSKTDACTRDSGLKNHSSLEIRFGDPWQAFQPRIFPSLDPFAVLQSCFRYPNRAQRVPG